MKDVPCDTLDDIFFFGRLIIVPILIISIFILADINATKYSADKQQTYIEQQNCQIENKKNKEKD